MYNRDKIYNIDKKIFFREELNGITVYNSTFNDYSFYEDCNISDFFEKNTTLTKENLYNYLNAYKKSTNIKFRYPFRINWLVSDYCNLNCIYCFADNKLNSSNMDDVDYKKVVKNLLHYRPLSVGLTGGEPTLNSNLSNIIDGLSGKCAIIIDTNGTTNRLETCLNSIIKSNATVRITVDSTDDLIINSVRPFCRNSFQIIDKNIKMLLDNNIRVIIHTVVTKKNLHAIEKIYDYIADKKIVKWQLYPVCYAEKCKKIYELLKVSDVELEHLERKLYNKNNGNLDIKIYKNSKDFSTGAVLMLDVKGNYFIDTIFNGIRYCGAKTDKPAINEIRKCINVNNHIDDYLG